nr:VP2 [Cosavirus D]
KPKVENDTNMEDRVITLKAGNTIVNSQASEGVLHGYGIGTNTQRPSSCGDDPSIATHCIERGFTINLADWDKSKESWQALVYRLSDHLKDDTVGNMFSKTLGTHAYTKCGYRVSLQINTSPFHSGLIGLFLVPECCIPASLNMDWIDLKTQLPLLTSSSHYQGLGLSTGQGTISEKGSIDAAGTIPQQLFIYPHQLINPKDTNIASVEVPYVNCAPTSDPMIHNIWTALVVVIAPLQSNASASPTVAMSMTVTPVGAVFNGLRHPAPNVQ